MCSRLFNYFMLFLFSFVLYLAKRIECTFFFSLCVCVCVLTMRNLVLLENINGAFCISFTCCRRCHHAHANKSPKSSLMMIVSGRSIVFSVHYMEFLLNRSCFNGKMRATWRLSVNRKHYLNAFWNMRTNNFSLATSATIKHRQNVDGKTNKSFRQVQESAGLAHASN